MDILSISIAVQKALRELGVEAEKKSVLMLEETEISELDQYGENAYVHPVEIALDITAGDQYTVVCDGTTYKCTAFEMEGQPCMGNLGIMNAVDLDIQMEDTGEPFLWTGGTFWVTTDKPHTFTIYHETETIHTIDPKFLPDETINLADYGIDVASLVAVGGGKQEFGADIAQKIKDDVEAKEPKYVLVPFGGMNARCAVAALMPGGLCCFLVTSQGNALVTVKMAIMYATGATGEATSATVVVEVS